MADFKLWSIQQTRTQALQYTMLQALCLLWQIPDKIAWILIRKISLNRKQIKLPIYTVHPQV